MFVLIVSGGVERVCGKILTPHGLRSYTRHVLRFDEGQSIGCRGGGEERKALQRSLLWGSPSLYSAALAHDAANGRWIYDSVLGPVYRQCCLPRSVSIYF
jgi:hypothetical protein